MRDATRGFTLVEVLVALVILTIVVTTSLGLLYDRQKRLLSAAQVTLAWQALANEAEARRHQPFAALQPGGETAFLTDLVLLEPLGDAQGRVTIESEGAGIRRLELRIEWDEGRRNAVATVYRTDTGGTSLW
ncbi:MAG: type IV pilus modification PilV family protein [Thermoanaerobaculia bacterium]